MRQVLSQEAYDELRPGLLDRALGLVLDGIGRLVDLIEGAGAAGPVGLAVLVLAVLVAGALIGRGVRRVSRSPAVGEPTVDVAGRSAADWLADAADAEARGDRREALRCRYRALVAELAAAGLVEELPGRTTGEVRADVGAAVPDAAEVFGQATDAFERAWYARERVDAADLAAVTEAVTRTRRAAGLGRVPA
ncbi:MAG: DUF4129 domain-containing protein [Egibacteraceae bacterium]